MIYYISIGAKTVKIIKIISNLLDSNTFILEEEGQVLIIDCGCEVEKVKKCVGDKKVMAILLTHGHYDHALYCNEYAKEFGCKIWANSNIVKTVSNADAFYSKDGSTLKD